VIATRVCREERRVRGVQTCGCVPTDLGSLSKRPGAACLRDGVQVASGRRASWTGVSRYTTPRPNEWSCEASLARPKTRARAQQRQRRQPRHSEQARRQACQRRAGRRKQRIRPRRRSSSSRALQASSRMRVLGWQVRVVQRGGDEGCQSQREARRAGNRRRTWARR
jgi:hypothetical protein